jgi:hypothetical protein
MCKEAVAALLADLELLRPKRIIQIGDLINADGIWTTHQRSYIAEMDYSYKADTDVAGWFLDEVDKRCPGALSDIFEGNHECRIGKTLARMAWPACDAKMAADLLSPNAVLKFKERGINYVRMDQFYDGLSTRGMRRFGDLHVVHGFSFARNADQIHLSKVNGYVVHGHTHRIMSEGSRNVVNGNIGAWSIGTLSELQPLYRHTDPSTWRHGYWLRFIEPNGTWLPFQVEIRNGVSLLKQFLDCVRPTRVYGKGA